jgi:hypothetical protein
LPDFIKLGALPKRSPQGHKARAGPASPGAR